MSDPGEIQVGDIVRLECDRHSSWLYRVEEISEHGDPWLSYVSDTMCPPAMCQYCDHVRTNQLRKPDGTILAGAIGVAATTRVELPVQASLF